MKGKEKKKKRRDTFPAIERRSAGRAGLPSGVMPHREPEPARRQPSAAAQERDLARSCGGAPAGELWDCLSRKSTMEGPLPQLRRVCSPNSYVCTRAHAHIHTVQCLGYPPPTTAPPCPTPTVPSQTNIPSQYCKLSLLASSHAQQRVSPAGICECRQESLIYR